MKHATLIIAVAAIIPALCTADEIKLANGTTVNGKFAAYKPATIEIVTASGTLTLSVDKLDESSRNRIPQIKATALAQIQTAQANINKDLAQLDYKAKYDDLLATSQKLVAAAQALADKLKERNGGVPEDVMDEIRAKAAKTSPDSYAVQLEVIKLEVAAWLKLNHVTAAQPPTRAGARSAQTSDSMSAPYNGTRSHSTTRTVPIGPIFGGGVGE
jgi:hypothetical protein